MDNFSTKELAVGYDDTIEAIKTGSIRPLNDVNNIESAIAMIADWNKQLDQLKELKKLRTKQIDNKISSLSENVTFMKSIIIQTLSANKEKTVRFPGVGKVTRRVTKGSWTVDSEEKLFEGLKERKEYENIVTLKPTIDKKELNKLLDTWESLKNLPEGVSKSEDTEGLALTIEDSAIDALMGNEEASDIVPKKQEEVVAPTPTVSEDVKKKDIAQLDFTK